MKNLSVTKREGDCHDGKCLAPLVADNATSDLEPGGNVRRFLPRGLFNPDGQANTSPVVGTQAHLGVVR